MFSKPPLDARTKARASAGLDSILRNTAYLSLARAVTVAARLAYVLLVARLLGPELYGLFNYGLSWYLLFVPLSVLGLDFLLLREIGRQRAARREIVQVSLAMRGFSSLLVASVCLTLGWWVEEEPLTRTLLLVFSIALLGRGLSSWANAVFKGHEASGYVLGQELTFRMLEIAAGVALLVAGQGLVALAAVHAAAWLAQGLVGVSLIRRIFEPGLEPRWALAEMGRLIRDGLPFLAAAFLLAWLMQGPLILYRHLGGESAGLGQLALALQVFVILGSILAELGFAALPVLARAAERQDGKTVVFMDVVLRTGWVMVGGLGVGGLALGPWIVCWLFGPAYVGVGDLVPWTLLLVGPYFWASSLRSVLAAHGRYWAVAATAFVGAAVFTTLFPVLVSYCAMPGAVFATGAGLVAVVISQLWHLRSIGSLNLERACGRPALVASAGIGVCVLLLSAGPLAALLGGLSVLVGGFFWSGTVPWGQLARILNVVR